MKIILVFVIKKEISRLWKIENIDSFYGEICIKNSDRN